MAIEKFSPPAFVNDLNSSLELKWSQLVQSWFSTALNYLKNDHQINEPFLFSLIDDQNSQNGPIAEIPWNGYPRKYKLSFTNNEERLRLTEGLYNQDLNGRSHRYRYKVDNRYVPANDLYFRDQDEYCEWKSYYDNETGELEKIIFTCENPEYWTFIAKNDPDLLLEKYREIVSPYVEMTDLFFQNDVYYPNFETKTWENQNGKYNPLNPFNGIKGIMHLSHPANSLSAEVFLAADATIPRIKNDGNYVTEDQDLICCAGYGSPNRFSDPTIGSRINTLVRDGFSVTINDPVGLYIHSIDAGSFEFPDGLYFEDCWKIERGKENMILRAVFEIPNGSSAKLSEIKIGGKELKYGGQIAEFLNMIIYGKAFDFKNGNAQTKECEYHCCTIPSMPNLVQPKPIDEPCEPMFKEMVFQNPRTVFTVNNSMLSEVNFDLDDQFELNKR